MVEKLAYCVKCRIHRQVSGTVCNLQFTTKCGKKSSRSTFKGKCPECGTLVHKYVAKQAGRKCVASKNSKSQKAKKYKPCKGSKKAGSKKGSRAGSRKGSRSGSRKGSPRV